MFTMNFLLFILTLSTICLQESYHLRHSSHHRLRHHARADKNHMRATDDTENETFNFDLDKNGSKENESFDPKKPPKNISLENGGALFPALLDIAPIAEISANSTCGSASSGSEEFCKLGGSMQCGVCSEIGGGDSSKKHPISFAIDSDHSNWWQSSTLELGVEYEYVTVTLDFKQVYYVWYIIIKCAISPRPERWILERSVDGVNFREWQYFTGNEDDCWQLFGMQATNGAAGTYTIHSDNETICTTHYSKIKPMEGGEIHAFIAKGRPGCVSSCTIINTQELRDFSSARFVRLKFQKFNVPKDKQSLLSDPQFQRRLFYSIKKISIGVQCVCNGHASKCKRSHDTSYCDCSHNTCGSNCERCCALYNQKAWKESTLNEVHVCEKCQCHGHAVACLYDPQVDANNASLNIYGEYKGGGVCINCTKHTTGINCEKCEPGWYRPSGNRADADIPCVPCECHQVGSTGLCVPDDMKFLSNGKKAGTCECLEGFDGVKCDKCANGFFNFPNCEKCDCDSRGTVLSESCERNCVCKTNVAGELCDKCKSGYFNLLASDPAGCRECFCSGISAVCSETKEYYSSIIQNLEGWSITSLNLSSFFSPVWNTEENIFLMADNEVPYDFYYYYWSAPAHYIGNKLTSYDLSLRITVSWSVMRGDTSGKPIFNPDVILVGSNGLNVAYDGGIYENYTLPLSIRLTEMEWYRLDGDLNDYNKHSFYPSNNVKSVTRKELLSILSDIKYLLVRGKFHTDQIDCSLLDAKMEVGTKEKGENSTLVPGLEQCVCPAGYTGLSCENCSYGFVRISADSSDDHFICSLCDCNGHSPTCDPVTARCGACEHNTTGPKCERCLDGFYGNAESGTFADCNPCACPLAEKLNNFSPTCKLVNGSQKDYICDSCPVGYTGTHCEICSAGYYGDPLKVGSVCVPCDCGGRPCNSTTGQCLSCEGNTEGFHCELCKEGYFRRTVGEACVQCDCNVFGSENPEYCDNSTGQCTCKMNYIGRACDRCLDGFGNITAGCIPCECNTIGSETLICDSVSGSCSCKKGVIGRYCDTCEENSYGFEKGTGCEYCECHAIGSMNSTCESTLGQCNCKQNVVGRTCDQCKEGYWNLRESGCVPCECDIAGSVSQICDQITGQCVCKFGISGRQCNYCLDNHYGFSTFGCFECEPCNKAGHICNVNNGRCVCPLNVEGAQCDRCIYGTWNYNTEAGCKECNCETQGSLSKYCDTISGKCECKVGYAGDKCEQCAPGYFGYPKCRPCACNSAGSDPETCTSDKCLCNEKGQCYCKVNVMGRKCDICKEGTFGLHAENIDGCTACFCFGRSTLCTEAGLIWSQIKLRPDRKLVVHYDTNSTSSNLNTTDIYPVNTQQICFINLALPGKEGTNINMNSGNGENGIIKLNVTNNLRLIPGDSGDIDIGVNYLFDAPVYWQLPNNFLGDKVLSYGGFIEFTTETEDDTTLLPSSVIASYPLIQIQGNDKFILEYFPPIITSGSHHRVRLHESLWKLKNNPTGHVSRDVFMMALQHLQHILIRATKSIDFTKATLSQVLMDIAMENTGPMPPLLSSTHGIELCECPVRYSSSSCQNPDIGYYRFHGGNRTTVTSTIVIQVVGEAVPCDCNGYSSVCDTETGFCLNCKNNTGGHYCETCAEGYYRDEVDATCKPCPCPSWPNNHAYTCSVPSLNYTNEPITCYCKTGYTGKYCDRCNYGWYGYPKLENGFCQPCKCDSDGSVSDECHEETGQCNCKPGITSRDCSVCEKPRHVLSFKGCTVCNDDCVQMLSDDADSMASRLGTITQTFLNGKLKVPWHLLNRTQATVIDARNMFNLYTDYFRKLLSYNDRIEEELKKKVKIAASKIKRIWKYNQNLSSSSKALYNEAVSFADIMNSLQDKLNALIISLQKYIRSEHRDYNLSAYVNEARYLLSNIKNTKDPNLAEKVENVLSYCRVTDDNIRSHENNGPGLIILKKKVEKLIERVDDLDFIIANSSDLVKQVFIHSQFSRSKFNWISDIIKQITETLFEVTNKQDGIHRNFSLTLEFMNSTRKNIRDMQNSVNNLKYVIQQAEEKEGILFSLNPVYSETYVTPALQYADTLMNQAKHYVGLFAATKADADIALRASTAYNQIVVALMEAQEGIKKTNEALEEIFNNLYSKENNTSIVEKARSMEETSRQLKTLAMMGLSEVDLLQKQFEYQQKYVTQSENRLQEIIKNISSITYQLNEVDKMKDKLQTMKDSLERSKNLTEVPDEVYDNIFSVQDNINDEIKPKLLRVQSYGELSIRPADILKVRETEEQAYKLVSQFQSTKNFSMKRNKYYEKWNASTANQLAALRSKIEQTKHLANGIHLSVCSKNDQPLCSRSYQLKYLVPSITNYISIIYAISSYHRDTLLFYLGSSITGDFLAVEMINRKIRFVWDVGGGPTELTHPMHIQTAGDLHKDQHWYKIEIERIANLGKLSVRPVISNAGSLLANGSPVTNASVPGWSRFDVASNDLVWIGGTNKPVSPFLLNKQSGLIGCLYQVSFDNKPIGLWNFKSESPDSCAACVEGIEEVREDDSYFFTGDGYAVLRGHGSSVYNKYIFSVSLTFRTFYENAILFYAVAAKPEQYIVLSIKDGRVLLQIGYRDDLKLEIKSTNRYTNGNWTHIEVGRQYDRKKKIEKGVLKVGSEVKEGIPLPSSPSPNDIPDLSSPQYFVGGLVPGFEPSIPLPGPFLGCMSDIQVNQETYNLLRGHFWGVQKSCLNKPLTTVGFKGNGYLELASYPLKKTSSFSFVFSTNQPETFLMLSTTEGLSSSDEDTDNDKNESDESQESKNVNYYSVSLRAGRIEFILNGGKGDTKLLSRTDTDYSDGEFHSVNVIKTGKRLELRVDDIIQAIGFMEEDSRGIVNAAGNTGGLFFGGLASDVNFTVSSVSKVPLIGTIKDAIFNEQLVQFDRPIEFEQALIGRLGPAYSLVNGSADSLTQNTEGGKVSCHKAHTYSVEPFAVQFGESLKSFVRLDYDRQIFHAKNATIELTFRTYYADGIVLLIPGSEERQNHYLKVFLQNGKINVIVKAKRKLELIREVSYNDGTWHHIKLLRDGKALYFFVDGVEPQKLTIPKKLNFMTSIYIGGVSDELDSSPEFSAAKEEPLKGCIKEVMINGRKEDLVGERAQHHHVGQCFPQIEKGAYFSGDAYSIYANNFTIGTSLELELDFRTSDLNGILMSISEPNGYPSLSLELSRGKIILNGDMGDRRPFKIEQEFPSVYYLCDNEWHKAKIVFNGEEIILHVDNNVKMYWLTDNGHITEARTNSPLYVGGVSEYESRRMPPGKENFKGCIRNVILEGRQIKWTEFPKLHNVRISSCPVH